AEWKLHRSSPYALDAITGEEKWVFSPYKPTQHEIPEEIRDPSIWRAEISSGPIVAGDMVYIGTRAGYLHALDRLTGEEQWRFKTDGYWVSEPFVHDGCLYFGCREGNLYALTEADSPTNI